MAAKKKTRRTDALAPQPDPRAPLDGAAFLAAAARVLATLRDDLLERADRSPGVTEALRAEHRKETADKRTGDAFEVWRRRVVVQVAAAWVLSVVFARTLEDRGLLDRNRIAGPGAADSQRQFLDLAPYLTERDYLLTVFRELSNLPAARELFDPEHNPVWRLAPSADGARALLSLFRAPDADAPAFRFGQADTRFLGDLYQDLDAETRERYALLQTPRFVEEFILDQTLEPALGEYGLDGTNILDPTCGSGHFLLGAFERLLDRRLRERPGTDVREAAKKALDAVHGVDLNPYAVAIARFRLTLAFLDKGGYGKLAQAPSVPLHVVVADSLLHGGEQAGFAERAETAASDWLGSTYAFVDEGAAKAVLGKQYAAVVGNPPYITVADSVLRDEYRKRYRACYREYSLAAPFAERFFELARAGGFVGMITANSFMKREFGKRLIEEYLKRVDLQLVVNTSGAYIPGHGTPTVLLFGRHRAPDKPNVLAVLAKRGEPSTPQEAENGLVWRSIAEHFREIGFENEYVSVAEIDRRTFGKHPWSLGGGGAAELKELLDSRAPARLGGIVESIGFGCITKQDDVFAQPRSILERADVETAATKRFVIGEKIRDWSIADGEWAIFPYDSDIRTVSPASIPQAIRFMWPFRRILEDRKVFGGSTYRDVGKPWYEYGQIPADRYRRPLSIGFAFVATHNHFVLDRGGKVFKQSAPIIKLPESATEEDHLALLGYLNSSTACFWMKQVMMNKGATSDRGVLQADPEKFRFEFDGTKLSATPVPGELKTFRAGLLVEYARRLSTSGSELASYSFDEAIERSPPESVTTRLAVTFAERTTLRRKMVAWQEEIDWLVYEMVGLIPPNSPAAAKASPDDVPGVDPDDRTYRKLDGQTPRCEAIASNAALALVERGEFKRRWFRSAGAFDAENVTDDMLVEAAAWRVLRTSLERTLRRPEPMTTVSLRAAIAALPACTAAAVVLRRDLDGALIREALEGDAVPFLAAHRYAEPGLEKRKQWEHTWVLQRKEDAGEFTSTPPKVDMGAFVSDGTGSAGMFVGSGTGGAGAFPSKHTPIPVPPKYGQEDYRSATIWRLRGKLDVPKERFISYPGCESDEDKSPVYGWAGWDHLQQAQALASLYQKRRTEEGWGKERLVPMLAGIDELVPWVKQWHNEPSAEYGGLRLGDYFADFVAAQCQELGVTLEEVRGWRPEAAKKARKSAKAKA